LQTEANEHEWKIAFQLDKSVGRDLCFAQDLLGAVNFSTKCKKGKPTDVEVCKSSLIAIVA
jgi:hypothetical protein